MLFKCIIIFQNCNHSEEHLNLLRSKDMQSTENRNSIISALARICAGTPLIQLLPGIGGSGKEKIIKIKK